MKKIFIVAGILLIIVGLFYWFQVRPVRIHQICSQIAEKAANEKWIDDLIININTKYNKINQGLENGTITNNDGLDVEAMKEGEIDKAYQNTTFNQEFYKNTYAACLHSRGL